MLSMLIAHPKGRRLTAGESGNCGLSWVQADRCQRMDAAADSARNLSDAVSVEVVTLGQDRDPEFRL